MYNYPDRLPTINHSINSVKGSFEEVHQNLFDRVKSLDLELRAVSIGLKNKLEETQVLREQMTRIFECLPVGAILINQDGHVQQTNRAAREICGLEQLLMEGQPLERAWRQLKWPSVPFSRFSYQGRILNCWEEVLGKPGTVPCLTVRFIEEDQAHSTQSQKPEERRMMAFGEKVAKIAHDLRNPLASIELFASLLERRPCNEAEHQNVGAHLLKSTRSLEQFVSNLLVGSKPQDAHIDKVNLHSLLDQVELLVTQPSRKRQVTIRRTVTPDAEVMDGDIVLLQQACLNLLINAISASWQGGVIDIDCRRVKRAMTRELKQDGESEVRIKVRDHGCGIKEEDLPHVCQPFYSTQHGGTGLGLSIVRDVMDAHHGTIDVQSREGQGTTVSLSFPQ